MILAIDPGTIESGFAHFCRDPWGGGVVHSSGIMRNDEIRQRLRAVDFSPWPDEIAVEMIAGYGMPFGAEVFETCVWIGRFIEALDGLIPVRLIFHLEHALRIMWKEPDIQKWPPLIDALTTEQQAEMHTVATRAGKADASHRARTGYEGVPVGLLGELHNKAKSDIKDAESRADMIRREIKRRMKHTDR